MKTLTTILTAAVILTSCGNKNQTNNCESQLTLNSHEECLCKLLAKKNSTTQKMKRSKAGLIIIYPKLY